jgi:hypothetical protein
MALRDNFVIFLVDHDSVGKLRFKIFILEDIDL